jgi:hypothetical protein
LKLVQFKTEDERKDAKARREKRFSPREAEAQYRTGKKLWFSGSVPSPGIEHPRKASNHLLSSRPGAGTQSLSAGIRESGPSKGPICLHAAFHASFRLVWIHNRQMADFFAKKQHSIRQIRRNITVRSKNKRLIFSELGAFRSTAEDYSSLSTQYPLPGVFAS